MSITKKLYLTPITGLIVYQIVTHRCYLYKYIINEKFSTRLNFIWEFNIYYIMLIGRERDEK